MDPTAAAAEAELAEWQTCLTDRIERMLDETFASVDELDRRIEGLAAMAEQAKAHADELDAEAENTSDLVELNSLHTEAQLEMIVVFEARKEIGELLDERDALFDELNETVPGLEAVRDGARAGNVDWSLCTG